MNLTFNKKQFAMLATGFLLSGLASASFAANTSASSPAPGTGSNYKMMHHGAGHHGQKHCSFLKELNLTAKQKEQLKAAHERFRNENKAEFESLRAKHEQLKALGTDPANAEKKQALRQELREGHRALSEKRHQTMDGIFTPEQQEKMKAIKAKCRAEHHHGPNGPMSDGSHHHHHDAEGQPADASAPKQ